MPGPINLGGNAAADIAASISAANAAIGDTSDESADSGDDTSGADDSAVVEDSEGEEPDPGAADGEADDPDAGDDDASEDEDEPAEVPADVAALKTQVSQLLVDGDLKAACKLLGIDPKVLKINQPKFEAMRKGLKEAKDIRTANDTRQKTLDEYKAKTDRVLEDGRKKFGPFVDLQNALALDDFSAAKEIFEGLDRKGRTFKEIAQGIVTAAANTSPSEAKYKRLLREQAEAKRKEEEAAEAAKKSTETVEQTKAMEKKNLDGAAAKLKGTQFEDIPRSAETLVRIVSENWDETRKGLKVPYAQILKLLAADPVMKLGLENKALKARKGATPAVTTPAVKPVPKDRKGPKVDPDAELKASMAEADRQMQAAARKSRRSVR
jgi:hypothetical protein